ncbi:hypothetical protein DO97_13105 [Neosynechococcus sphagnicola sy1]|uniref:Inositol monophosphatase n=1 Tax=Neosynechococcus sphagnicola sy1 TaxID=1497020 RepID=A0A098TNA3_9CYAN|nr:hypothetical protein [Neosynechococcus sphagnicola]KGF73736.1 hypothetical protein DO97_13105 [Neosynechococcus sphagnicola sy1]
MNYYALAQKISQSIKQALIEDLIAPISEGELPPSPANLKSIHKVDHLATKVLLEVLEGFNCNIYVESHSLQQHRNAKFSIFVDPVDGSLNWDRRVGDPCIVVAISEKTKEIKLKDLEFAYVEGLRSGDIYYTEASASYYINYLIQKNIQIQCQGKPCLADAIAYLRPGYSLAKQQLEASLPVFLLCRDIRAFDNAGMEICEIARNAADLMIEARKGSDNFNLLSYPILKYAGGILCDLDGNSLDEINMELEQQIDYIVCNHQLLLAEVLLILQTMKKSRCYTKDNLRFSY